MNHAFASVAFIASVAGILAQAPSGESTEPERGVLAVLRRDGIMFPFASFRGNTWTAPWPGGLRNVELPINLESVPERWWGGWTPESWNVWFADGTSRDIRALAPAQFRIHCGRRLGLKTDYRPSQPAPMMPTEPFPKDGLVATSGIRVEPIQIVRPADADWGALAIALLKDFNRAEDAEISAATDTSGWSHPTSRSRRRQLPVKIESWYRTTLEGDATVSYIEAVRSYPPRPEDDGCGLETLISGWVYHAKGKLAGQPDLAARLMYCDRMNAAYMLPLGRMRVRDRIYWVSQMSGHEAEGYAVARITPTRATIVADYFAGSRESCR